MWNSKPKAEAPKEPDLVVCDTCKHLIRRYDAQIIPVINYDAWGNPNGSEIYCPEHRKPYARKTHLSHFGDKYFREMEVDEKGEPIKPLKPSKN